MFQPHRPSAPGNRSANLLFNFKRSALLPLLIVLALVGVVFSGSSRSVLSSGAMMENRAETGTVATNVGDGSNAAGFVRGTANQASLSSASSGSSLPSGAAGNEVAESTGGSDDQVALNHARVTPKFFPALPLLPAITASMTDALVPADDVNSDGNVDPGDKITYTVTITNSGSDATAVKFSDTIDSHTTLFGTPNTSPIANVDTYSASGNIPISINVASGVLSNDIDPDTGLNTGLTVTEVQGLAGNVGVATNTTATGRSGVKGSVTLASNGSFTYEPPPGFEGADTFTYKTSDGTATDTTTVTINISGMVWFIQTGAGGSNRGTFSNPFTTIASFNTANTSGVAPDAENGDFISLRTGTYNETDGINLRNTQKLIGNAIQFNTVFTAAADSSSAYTTFASGTASAPTITTSGGNGIDLADSNTVRGVNVGNTPGFFKLNGGAVGSPIINTINLTGTGGAINVSTSGAFSTNVSFATLESSSSPTSNLNLVSVTGTLGVTSGGTGLSGSAASSNAITINGGSVTLNYPGNVTKGTAGSLVNVSNSHTGTLTFPGTLSATLGDGLQFNNADGTYNFTGTTTLAGGDAGIDIAGGSTGTFSFNSNTTITNPTNEAISILSGSQSFTYSGSFTKSGGGRGILAQNNTGGTITFDGPSATETKSISTTGANAIDLLTNSNTTINFTGNNLVLSATGSGIGINATGGTLTVQGTGNTITTVNGAALNIVNNNIGASGLTFQSINVNGTGNGIVLNNTGQTAGTNGGLNVTGTGTTAGSGGTITGTVQGALFTTTRDLVLKNMNFTNANSGNGTCQNVDNSNFNSACQGAINMNGVINATFDNLSMNGGAQIGINGRTVSNLSILNSTVQNFGGGAAVNQGVNENNVRLFNLTGTCTITNSDFSFAAGDTTAGESLVDIRNDTGTLTLNVDGDPSNTNSNNFTQTQDSSDGSYGLTVTAVSSANTTVNVRRSNFLNIKTAGIATFARGSAIMNVNITGAGNSANGNTFDPVFPKLGRAIDLNAQDTAQLNFNINENPKIYGTGGPIINIFGTVNAQINGHIRNNPDIKNAGLTTSVGSAIYFHPEDSADGRVEITGNTISGIGQDKAILLLNHGNGMALLDGVIDAIVASNNISIATAGANNSGIYLNGGANAGDQNKVCGYIHNNAVTTGLASHFAFVVFVNTPGSHVYLQNFSVDAAGTWNNPANGPNTETGPGSAAIQNSPTEPATSYSFNVSGQCRTPTNAVAAIFEPDPNSTLAQSGAAFSSLGSTIASLTADYVPAGQAIIPTPSAGEAHADLTSADTTTQTQAVSASLTAIAATTETATALNTELAHASSNQPVAGRASVNKNRKAMQLSHALRTRTRTSALAAALSGETFTIDGAGGAGFTLPAGKTITVTFKVTVNDPPNLINNPYPTGGPQVSNQGTVTAAGGINVLTDDPAPPVGPNGASDPTVTLIDLYNSQTSVVSSNHPSSQGDPVTFTATVAQNQAGSPGTPTGTVTFLNDGNPITCNEPGGSTQPLTAGVATCTTSAILPGGSPHTITAQYNGDGNFDPSSGTTPQTVIACSGNPIVTSNADSGPNTLRDAIANICNAPSNNITFNLGAGPHTITTLSTLVIAKNVNITNTLTGTNGPLTVTANGGNFRVFRVDSPVTSANLSGFTVTGANTTTGIAGGGIFVANGTTTLSGMLFTGNTVINSGGGGVGVGSGATINLRNSTISGNTATNGGGIYNNAGTLNLLNVTVTNNTADGNVGGGPVGGPAAIGGGIDTTSGTATNVKNSIVAGNFATSSTNIAGTINDQLNNILTGDPRLATLANNGGATRTHALLIDSPAFDAGDNAASDAIPLTTDQRGTGFARKLDAAADADTTQTVDIGAYEADPTLQDITDKTTPEDTPIIIPFNVGDAATAFDSITATSGNATLVPNVLANISITGSGSSRNLNITPAANENGTSTITVTVTKTVSGTTLSMTDTFVLTVTEVNDAPTANADALSSVAEDSGQRTITIASLLANDSKGPANESGQTLTLTGVGSAVGGTVSNDLVNVYFTPTANFSGAASFQYTITDDGTTAGGADPKTATGTVSFTITDVNDAPTLDALGDLTINEDAPLQTVNLAGISAGGGESQTLTVTATSNNTGLIPNPTVTYTSPNATGSISFTPVANQSGGPVTITVTVSDNGGTANGGVDSFQRTFTVTVNPVNDAPTLNTIPDPAAILEDAAQQTVNLAGISAGASESQTLTVTATSNNTALIPNPTVTYTSPNATGSLSYTPVANQSGSAIITVTVTDDGGTTNGGVNSFQRTFTVTVTPVNDVPTLDAIGNATILEDAGAQTVNLAGISAGASESQTLTVTATSNNTALIPNPTVTYTSPNATGSLSYTPVADQNGGPVTITVTVMDNGGTTNGGVDSFQRTFTVTVTPVNDAPTLNTIPDPAAIPEDTAGAQTVNLAGISVGPSNETGQSLTVTAVSNNTALIPNPTVTYTSPNATGSLSYTPVANKNGTAIITVTVTDDGGTSSGGVNSFQRTFTVTVTPIADSPTVSNASTTINTQTTSGLVITPNAADDPNTTFFKITNIQNGTLYKNDGTTVIANNTFITAAEGAAGTGGAGLKFTPNHNLVNPTPFGFDVQASTSASNAGLGGGVVSASISVTCSTGVSVKNTNDSGPDSLRNAIVSTCPGETITFDPVAFAPAGAPYFISILSELPIDKNLTINGPGAKIVRINGGIVPHVFNISSGTVSINDLRIENGNGVGAGISNAGTLTLTNSTVAGAPITGGSGIANTGTITIRNSIVVGHTSGSDGGGLTNSGTANIYNSTIGPNVANARGGGIYNTGTLTIRNSTIAGNQASGASGGGGIYTTTPVIVGNTIIAGNKGPAAIDWDVAGPFTTEGHNLIGVTDASSTGFTVGAPGANGDWVGTTASPVIARIGLLADNGGPTQTFALLAGSPALDGGDDAIAIAAGLTTTDQRGTGFARKLDAADANTTQTVDIGAFEADPSVEDITNKTTAEDTAAFAVNFNVGDAATAFASITAVSSNTTLVPNNPANLNISGSGSTRTLNITPASNLSGTSTITVTVTKTVGGTTQSMTDTFVLTVTEVNDAPTANDDALPGIGEDSGVLVIPFSTLTANDSAGPPDESGQSLIVKTVSNPVGGTVQIVGTDVRFTPTADFNGAASFQYTVEDNGTTNGAADPKTSVAAANVTFGVTGVNDAPTLDALGNLTINEDAPLQTVNLTGISAGDAESQTLTVTATSNNTGLIPNPTVTYTSPNATGSISFTPVADQSGSALITVTVSDGGGTANGGVETVVRTFTVTVNAVNDAPVNTVPGAQTTNENAALTFSAANSNLISIADVDAGVAIVQVTLTATNGTLTLSSTAGLAFTVGDGTADATMTFTGTIASINSALAGLVFTPTSGFHGAASVQIVTNDQGNTGSGGALTDTDTISITVNEHSLQFNSATYTVGEADGHATITVTRTGSTTLPASVDYETSDLSGLNDCNVNTGNASQRCDYTSMRGTVNFIAGQSSATFDIPIINDVYVEGPETLTLTLSNVTGGLLGTPSVATLTINDNDLAPGAVNPIDTVPFFIRQQYLDFLNREPEPSGLADWLAIINNCPVGDTSCDYIQVSSGFFRSAEFFDRTYYVYRFYETALGRKPSYDEYQHDIARLTGFLTTAELEQRKAEYAEEFSQRTDFKALYDSRADGDDYVNAIVATAGVTPSNKTDVATRQGAHVITRGRALRELLETPEISQRFYNKAFVVVGYFAYLRRDPDAQYLVWLDLLNNPPANRTYQDIYREMIRGFIQSQEYRARFGLP